MLARILLLALALAPSAIAQHAHETQPSREALAASASTDSSYLRFKKEMDQGMKTMMRDMHAPGYVGNPDIDFLAMMIPHHEGAVEMARLVLVHGRDPATRRLAEDIIASQSVEIEGMKRRLAALRSGSATGGAEYPALGGTRGPAP